MTHDELARALLDAVRAQHFERGGEAFPSLDLAVVACPRRAAPVWANVLFSREHPRGVVAAIGPDAGAVSNIRYDADLQDARHLSPAWLPGADWSALRFEPLAGAGVRRFVAPYPASLVKLMVAVGVGRAVDDGACGWEQALTHERRTRPLAQWCEDMIACSDNAATDAMVALLHRCGQLGPEHAGPHALHRAFAAHGLHTLRLARTRPDGGWRNADGAGVGALQMTAWDSARLLWQLDADAPPAPWLDAGTPPLLSVDGRARLRGWLDDQARHEVLSSTALAGVPGWVPGLPARVPARWITVDGGVAAGGVSFPPDVRAASASAPLAFAHKTGSTDNYAADAGIVSGIAAQARRHYIVALLTSLGRRHAPHPLCATSWRVPTLGRAIDAALAPWLEAA